MRVGRRVGQLSDYTVVDKIGEGGMASVFRGVQTSLNRPVAIKVLSKKLIQHPEIVERFNHESLIIARLNHPNIIHVIDRGIADGGPYFVMDFVEGTDLARIIRAGSYDFTRKVEVILQVCKALAYAHKNGVIHRDIKPANILIDGEGNALVSDFGIAQLFEGAAGAGGESGRRIVMGTPSYMSPEQKADSSRVTAASDLFSLGVVMYELFAGTKPPQPIRAPSTIKPEIPEALDCIILRCVEPDPADRFASADELKDRLLDVAQGAHIQQAQRDQALQGIRSLAEKFVLRDVIKEHRYGAVYVLEDRRTHQLMVLKKVTNKTGGLEESRRLSKLDHPHLAGVYGTSSNDKAFIIVMEYVSSGSLKDRMAQVRPWREALGTLREICDGMAFAHRHQIVHGNLRPTNILISRDGRVKLADFGLDEHYAEGDGQTNWYSRPGEPYSARGDIFSVGVILYEMLTGSIPVERGGRYIHHDSFRRLPRPLQAVVNKMIALEPADRYPSFDDVLVSVDGLLSDATLGDRPVEPTPVPSAT
ncbi:MAG: protein kinase domain-containing protein [Nitrospirota bacterium]